jgi:hypothetical protein
MDSDLAKVHSRVKQLVTEGKSEAMLGDFHGLFGPQCDGFFERQRLGMALVALGVRSRRVRRGDGQERVYDIRPLADSGGQASDADPSTAPGGRDEGDNGTDSAAERNDQGPK